MPRNTSIFEPTNFHDVHAAARSLRLFARRGLETRGKFRGHLAAQPIKESAHDTHRAGKAHFSDLLAKTHPGETKLFKALLEVILEGIEL